MPLSFSSPFLPSTLAVSLKLVLPLFFVSCRQEIRSVGLPLPGAHGSSSTASLQLHIFTSDNSVWVISPADPITSLSSLIFQSPSTLFSDLTCSRESPLTSVSISDDLSFRRAVVAVSLNHPPSLASSSPFFSDLLLCPFLLVNSVSHGHRSFTILAAKLVVISGELQNCNL
ncbi:hypothetical protein HHK36_012119 [Tetracentron sinense]|uniref:Uncharacterized protein n=1 Tax=Tetracentron sinense TaxID=13715 RepID=A0A835DF86_TETSI|nr:hypothetical protein HHK36_012119 [Tetracentron sinense]